MSTSTWLLWWLFYELIFTSSSSASSCSSPSLVIDLVYYLISSENDLWTANKEATNLDLNRKERRKKSLFYECSNNTKLFHIFLGKCKQWVVCNFHLIRFHNNLLILYILIVDDIFLLLVHRNRCYINHTIINSISHVKIFNDAAKWFNGQKKSCYIKSCSTDNCLVFITYYAHSNTFCSTIKAIQYVRLFTWILFRSLGWKSS